MHLNEFSHSECELPGNFEEALDMAEEYIKYLGKYLVEKYKLEIVALAQSTATWTGLIVRTFHE